MIDSHSSSIDAEADCITALIAVPQLSEDLYQVQVAPATTYRALCRQFCREIVAPLVEEATTTTGGSIGASFLFDSASTMVAYFDELQSADPYRPFAEQRLFTRTVTEVSSDVAPTAWIVSDGGLTDCTMNLLRAALGLSVSPTFDLDEEDGEPCRHALFLGKHVQCILLLRVTDPQQSDSNRDAARWITSGPGSSLADNTSKKSTILTHPTSPPLSQDPNSEGTKNEVHEASPLSASPLRGVPLSLTDLTRRLRMLDSQRVLSDVDLRLRQRGDDVERRVQFHLWRHHRLYSPVRQSRLPLRYFRMPGVAYPITARDPVKQKEAASALRETTDFAPHHWASSLRSSGGATATVKSVSPRRSTGALEKGSSSPAPPLSAKRKINNTLRGRQTATSLEATNSPLPAAAAAAAATPDRVSLRSFTPPILQQYREFRGKSDTVQSRIFEVHYQNPSQSGEDGRTLGRTGLGGGGGDLDECRRACDHFAPSWNQKSSCYRCGQSESKHRVKLLRSLTLPLQQA